MSGAETDPRFVVEIDEDPEGEAAWLRSLGLDPDTATIDDLNRVLPPAETEADRVDRRPGPAEQGG